MAATPTPSHPQIVCLPYVPAAAPDNPWLQEAKIRLPDRVKAVPDEADAGRTSPQPPAGRDATMRNNRPCFVWLFAAVSRLELADHTPHMVRIAAPDELTARRLLVGRYVLSFAGRVPVQEVRHV
ncbi:host cell division inhibitor Icd-like protein [Salmonella enterica]|uniref:host cell division inhibitor Icd-like protein n=1 Tax=Salmonella enterica TaxID=28901 RepID=UPI002159E193|nr:host cell division inhibitor Icd-like protein [Salmonella enterica]